MSLSPGARLGPYEVLSRLGAGGMGEVYRAHDTRLDRIVALKVLPADRVTDAEARGRFEREAKAVAALSHPNICVIYDVELSETVPTPFLVMELLEGQTLQERLLRGPLEIDQIVEMGSALADALETAHARGLIHRDLKPANIFITSRGVPKILDFGLAKALGPAGGPHSDPSTDETRRRQDALTELGTTVGTIAYMSPEQLRGEPLDVRSDVFSFGLVLYEMTTGHRAFAGATSAVVSAAILMQEPAAPTTIRADVPPPLEEIILKTIDKDRQTRCQSAAEIRADLLRLKRRSGTETARVASLPPMPAKATTLASLSGPYTGAGATAPSTTSGSAPASAASTGMRPATIVIGAIVGIGILAAGFWLGGRGNGATPPPLTSTPVAANRVPSTPTPAAATTPPKSESSTTVASAPSPRPTTPVLTSPLPTLPTVAPTASVAGPPAATPTPSPTTAVNPPAAEPTPAGRNGRGAPGGRRGAPGSALPSLIAAIKDLPPLMFDIVYPAADARGREMALGLRTALVNNGWTCASAQEGPNPGVPLSVFVPQPSASVNALVGWARRNGFDPQVHPAPRAPRLRIVFGRQPG